MKQPAGTVTLVFTDVEGSTRLLHELGQDAYRDALGEHRRIVRDAFARHDGYEVDYEGDAFFYAFASASDAVAAVEEAMRGLEAGPIRIRVGVHTGQPGLDPPKYVGADVHKAARVMSAGHGGQVLISRSTRELVDADLTELGEHRLKDFDQPVAIFQLGDGQFPPLKTISNTNLPRPVSSFVGRETEVEHVVGLVRESRLVTLTGPGGTGKTRLAIEAATSLVGEFKAGVFWAGLATLHDPGLVLSTIANALGAKDDLPGHIGERDLLLLLDNFEQIVDAAPHLSALLQACPNLHLLVTSRELLRIQGETDYPVPPLAATEAIQLFSTRAHVEADDTIRELCRRLDNLPLPVELAAARTSALTPAQILERISQRLDLLKGGRDTDPRQQTLRATIEWSHDLLTDNEKHLFAHLAVFAGGSTLDAAEEVADADLDTLQSLVEKSLLRHTDKRYWMLETIREYAAERLESHPEAHDLLARHADWCAALAEARESEIRAEEPEALGRLAAEEANLRAALEWSSRAGEQHRLLRLAGGLGLYWFLRAELEEGERWLAEALSCADATPAERGKILPALVMVQLWLGRLDEAARSADELLDVCEGLDPQGRADALHVAGLYYSTRGDSARSSELYEASAAISRRTGNAWLLRQTLNNLGEAARSAGDVESAERHFEEALSIEGSGGDGGIGAIAATVSLAAVAIERGDLTLARARLRGSLDLLRPSAYREGGVVGPALVYTADIAERGDDPEAAGTLLGAVDAFLAQTRMTVLYPLDQRAHDETQARVAARLGQARARELARAGSMLDVEAALGLALELVS